MGLSYKERLRRQSIERLKILQLYALLVLILVDHGDLYTDGRSTYCRMSAALHLYVVCSLPCQMKTRSRRIRNISIQLNDLITS